MAITEKLVQNSLHRWLSAKGYNLTVPNFTPEGWWECDLYGLTKAGLAVEFEVKLTRSDFKQDAKKAEPNWKRGRLVPPTTKYERLVAKEEVGPTRFFYVTPPGLLKPEELPEWSGLIEVPTCWGQLRPRVAVKAPKLHGKPPAPKTLERLQTVFYWRFWSLRTSLKGLPEGPEIPDPLQIALSVLNAAKSREDYDLEAGMVEAFKNFFPD